jgi:hypothetical protein
MSKITQILFWILVIGTGAGVYRLESATNVFDWTQLLSFTNSAASATRFLDRTATNSPVRYYRLIAR